MGKLGLPPVRRAKPIDKQCGHSDCKHKGTYLMGAVCSNCHWRGEFTITKGHGFWNGWDCPNCGVPYRLIPQGDPAFAVNPEAK
jgi:hypothetical protein